MSVRPSVPLAQPQRSDSARVALFSPRAPPNAGPGSWPRQHRAQLSSHAPQPPLHPLGSHPSAPQPPGRVPFRWIISERMERASSEVLSVAQETARLRKDTLSSSEDAQDCVGRGADSGGP